MCSTCMGSAPIRKSLKVVDAGHDGAGFAFERAFAPADQALVGFEFDEDIGAVGVRSERNAEDFHAGDFQPGLHVGESAASPAGPACG